MKEYIVKIQANGKTTEFYFETFEEAMHEYEWRKTYDNTIDTVDLLLHLMTGYYEG